MPLLLFGRFRLATSAHLNEFIFCHVGRVYAAIEFA